MSQTSSLSPQGIWRFYFPYVRKIVRDEGVSIVFCKAINWKRCFNICNEVTVLRDGKNACTSESIKNLDRKKLVKLMIGREEQIVKSDRKNDDNKDTDPGF